MAFKRARLNCDVAASSSMWLVPADGRQAVGRCREVSGVTLAAALTATAQSGVGTVQLMQSLTTSTSFMHPRGNPECSLLAHTV